MSKVIQFANACNWKYCAATIAATQSKQIASIVETGQLLIEAK
jgi:hypothetical protein